MYVAADIKVARNLGLIWVLIHHVTLRKKNKDKKETPHKDQNSIIDRITIIEKALKGKVLPHVIL